MRNFLVSVLLVAGFAVFFLWPEERRSQWLVDEVGADEVVLTELDDQQDAGAPVREPLSGHVRGLDGAGVPGVTVRLEHAWVPEVRARTDADGRFVLGPKELRGVLELDAAEWVLLGGERILAEGVTEGYVLAVAPPFEQAGLVTDTDGKPLAGAELATRVPVGAMVPLGVASLPLDEAAATGRTDKDGRFRLTRVPAVPGLELEVRADGYRPSKVALAPPEAGAAAEPVTIALEPDTD